MLAYLTAFLIGQEESQTRAFACSSYPGFLISRLELLNITAREQASPGSKITCTWFHVVPRRYDKSLTNCAGLGLFANSQTISMRETWEEQINLALEESKIEAGF